jgi:peptide deformylase
VKITKSKKKLNHKVFPESPAVSLQTSLKMWLFCKRNGQNWLGLASNQVGLKGRVICIKINQKWKALINPRIVWSSEGKNLSLESCLSVKDKQVAVVRNFGVRVLSDGLVPQTLYGQESFCVQHEIDHLNGILMTDRKVEGNLWVDEMIKKESE